MVTKIADVVAGNTVPSAQWNWLVDLTDGTGVSIANVKYTSTSGTCLFLTSTEVSGTTVFIDSQLSVNTGNKAVHIFQQGTSFGLVTERNVSSAIAPVVRFIDNNTTSNKNVLELMSSGGFPLYIDNNTSDVPVKIDAGPSGTGTSATAGANGDVPAQVQGYLIMNVDGTDRKFPYYQV